MKGLYIVFFNVKNGFSVYKQFVYLVTQIVKWNVASKICVDEAELYTIHKHTCCAVWDP